VCDNCSNDGSREILQEYARRGKIKLVVETSSRGRGRKIAFENSTGKYIISGIDTDDRLKPAFKVFPSIYHRDHEGYMLSVGTIHIIPRQLVEEIGGWRDLKWGEDIDFHKRAKSLGRQHELEHPLVLVERGKNKRSFAAKVSDKFNASICMYKMGKSVYDQVKMTIWFYKPIIVILALSAIVMCKCRHIQQLRYPKV
jgi:glycosyltransferase involved in cell wall biosynthesis